VTSHVALSIPEGLCQARISGTNRSCEEQGKLTRFVASFGDADSGSGMAIALATDFFRVTPSRKANAKTMSYSAVAEDVNETKSFYEFL